MLRLMLCTIMKLRDYQTECIDTMHKHFKSSNRQLIQMPTGAGKTITFLKYISLYCKRSIIIVPTRELLEQVEESSWNFMHKIDLQALHVVFAKFKDRLINEITYDELVLFCKEYLSTPLTKGGSQKNGTGRLIMPSKMTLLSKLRRLSSIYSNLIDNGIPVENIAIKVGAWLNGQKSE